MKWSLLPLTCLVVGISAFSKAGTPRGPTAPIDAWATTLVDALPPGVTYANARWDKAILDGPRRIPVETGNRWKTETVLSWVRRVMHPKWYPEKGLSSDSLIMIRGEDGRPDVVRVTWQTHGYQIDVSQLAPIMVIGVTPVGKTDMGKTVREKISFVRGICAELFTDQDVRGGQGTRIPVKQLADKIWHYSFRSENVRVFNDGIVGWPVTEEQAGVWHPGDTRDGKDIDLENRPDNPSWDQSLSSWAYWWRHVCWWHDGATIGFYFPKMEAGPIRITYFSERPLRWLEKDFVFRPARENQLKKQAGLQ